jgi:hypothetical protein
MNAPHAPSLYIIPKGTKQPKPDTNREEKQGPNGNTNFKNNYSN